MTKAEYLQKLKRALRPIKEAERSKSLAYFSEQIDDRIEEGISEADAIAGLEDIDSASVRIIAEAESQGLLKRKFNIFEIVLLVLGFPLWFPLLMAAALIIATLYALVWVFIGVLFIASIVLALSGAACIIIMFFLYSFPTVLAALGSGLICAGAGMALFIAALFLTRVYMKVTPVIWQKLKSLKGGIKSNV